MRSKNEKALSLADAFACEGYLVTPVRTPTVPAGTERVRISLSAALGNNDVEDINKVMQKSWIVKECSDRLLLVVMGWSGHTGDGGPPPSSWMGRAVAA